MTYTATPLAVCRRVREYAADFSNSMSAALLLNTDHEVGRPQPLPLSLTPPLTPTLTLAPALALTLTLTPTLTLTLTLTRWAAASRTARWVSKPLSAR